MVRTDQRSFRVALVSEMPTPLPGLTAGGHTNYQWWSDKVSSVYRQGYNKSGEGTGYVTLVRLQILARGWKEWWFGMTRRDSLPLEPKSLDEM